MSKHTRGPWTIDPDSNLLYHIFAPSEQKALAVVYGPPNGESNAALISAAPELLAACKRARDAYINADFLPDALEKCMAAIAKAEGEK
jgi:hypothetical protein